MMESSGRTKFTRYYMGFRRGADEVGLQMEMEWGSGGTGKERVGKGESPERWLQSECRAGTGAERMVEARSRCPGHELRASFVFTFKRM
jgi:hypothetical protein